MTVDRLSAHKGNVLIVDDTLPNLRVLARILQEQGYLVRGIPNGTMALTAAASEKPDLILLDIMMPGMDGYTVCRQLKADPTTADIPVIFMSALDEVLDKVKAFDAGGVDYITKPFQVEEVLARVETHLELQALRTQLQDQVLALQEANAALHQSNSELDAFAHTVAHDLKNPISNMLMVADLVESIIREPEIEKLDDIAQWLNSSSRKAMNIIDELLLLASVRKEDVVLEPFDMARVVEQAQKRLGWMIREHQAKITLPSEWPVVLGYAPWVEEVWVNYLSNGLKYGGTPPELLLGAKVLPGGMVRHWIADNGPGIPQEKLALLFTEFTKTERVRTQGHGLGLSIVKRIVSKLGGDVGVRSQVGKGSLFSFTLPTGEASAI